MAATPLPPPPKRRVAPLASTSQVELPYSSQPEKETWKAWSARKSTYWGKTALVKGIAVSDTTGTTLNGWSEKMGSERFWPVTGDFPQEMAKCAAILRAFTVDGIPQKVALKSEKGKSIQQKITTKIPPQVIASCKGLAIFTSMRTGLAPFAGAGGAGIIVAKLDDGSWSAPSAMSPNNVSVGLMLGVDIYDAVLVIRTQEALDTFRTHKATLGGEVAVVAGPHSVAAAGEAGIDKSPVFSYVRSRGMYAGVEVVAQVFLTRTEENEKMYWWPGIKPGDILAGKVKVPLEAADLIEALQDAETGKAQSLKPLGIGEVGELTDSLLSELQLEDGEVLRLPPTPEQLDAQEAATPPNLEYADETPPLPRRRRRSVDGSGGKAMQALTGDGDDTPEVDNDEEKFEDTHEGVEERERLQAQEELTGEDTHDSEKKK